MCKIVMDLHRNRYVLTEVDRQFEIAEDEMDLLIVTLSKINPNNFLMHKYSHPVRVRTKDGTILYQVSEREEEKIEGKFTNEAPSKYLVDRKTEETYNLFGHVIILGTNECENETIRKMFENEIEKKEKNRYTSDAESLRQRMRKYDDKTLSMTTLDYYKAVLKAYMKEKVKTLWPDDTSSDDLSMRQTMQNMVESRDYFVFLNVDNLESGDILRNFQELAHSGEEDDMTGIYMDYTGGTRVTSLVAMMLCRWLEVNDYKLRCAVYCNINNNANRIEEITDIYGLFNAIIAHDKQYEVNLRDSSKVLENESAKYGLQEYRKSPEYGLEEYREKKKPEYIPASDKNGPFIFLSYSHLDHYPAQAVVQKLQSAGYRVWYDEGIEWNTYWEETLEANLKNCRMAIILLSHNYLYESTFCRKELEALENTDKPVIWLENFEITEEDKQRYSFLTDKQGIQYFKYSSEGFYQKLLAEMEKMGSAREAKIDG